MTSGRVAQLVRAHAAVVDPWLADAGAWGVDAATVRTALGDLEPVTVATGADPRVVLPLVRATLDLVVRGAWHEHALPRRVVLEVLTRLPRWVAACPDVVVPAVLTAARGVARSGALEAWVTRLSAAPPPALGEHVRPALLVAAWRSGMVRYREAALDAAAQLSPDVVAPLLDVPPHAVGQVLDLNRADRWWWFGREERPGVVQRVGGFVGWGGPWVQVPRVAAGGPTGWLVLVDGTAGAVVADVHGSAVVGVTPPTDLPVPDRPDSRALPVPWSDEVTGVVADADGVLLVARAHSCVLDVVRPGRLT